MGSNRVNLAIRFLLEIAALVSMGIWGWRQREDWIRFILAIGIPLAAAVAWGLFAVRDDPSRSGAAPIPVPGLIRLLLELAFFGLSVWMLYHMQYLRLSWILGITVALHYLISYDRIRWLIRQ
jgi:hypothetical protein